jgi:hypothetical protein
MGKENGDDKEDSAGMVASDLPPKSPFRFAVKPVYQEEPLTREMKNRLAELELSHIELKKRMQKMAELEASHSALKRQLEDMLKVQERLDMHQKYGGLPSAGSKPTLVNVASSSFPEAEFRKLCPSSKPVIENKVPGNVDNVSYVNILQEMGQAVYIFRPTGEITYW